MAGIWVHGETAGDGSLTKLSTEVATLARSVAEGMGDADVTGVVVAGDPGSAAEELARFVPKVMTFTEPSAADHAAGMIVAQRLATLIEAHDPDIVMMGAGPEGRDLAGALSALTGWGVLANATAVEGTPDGPVATHSVFGGKLITESAFTNGKGIITVRPNSVTAEPAGSSGTVEAATVTGELQQPAVPIVDRLDAETKAAQIDDARLVVVKRDGTRQEFDRDKLVMGLRKALTRRPVPENAAEIAGDRIEAELRAEGMTEVPSSRVGALSMQALRALDQIAYIRFASVYQSFEDLEDLKREVDNLYAEKGEGQPVA